MIPSRTEFWFSPSLNIWAFQVYNIETLKFKQLLWYFTVCRLRSNFKARGTPLNINKTQRYFAQFAFTMNGTNYEGGRRWFPIFILMATLTYMCTSVVHNPFWLRATFILSEGMKGRNAFFNLADTTHERTKTNFYFWINSNVYNPAFVAEY